nr:hypothetical protein [uncultured Methanoregula sp.]
MSDTLSEMESKDKKGWSTGTKVLVGVIAIIVLVAIVAVFTLTIAVLDSDAGTQYPYVTTYTVSLPDGEPVTIGNTRIVVMSYENEVLTDVDGNKEKLTLGQQRVISPHSARISALGIPLLDTDFQITLTYLGTNGKNALFDLTLKTSKQIPDLVLRQLIPAKMNAQPK